MTAFDINISHDDEIITLTIIPKDDYFIIFHAHGIIGATRKEGSDWILMQQDEIEEWNLTGYESSPAHDKKHVVLGAAEINQIAGEIENHLR